MPVSLIVTVNEPDPFTTSPVPDTPLAFCAPFVNLMVGVGGAAGDVVEDAGPPPQATIANRPTREITNRLISATSVQSAGAQGDTASSYIRGCAKARVGRTLLLTLGQIRVGFRLGRRAHWASGSAAPELRLAFARVAGVELAEVVGGHQQGLGESLHFDRGRVVGRGRAVEHLLGHRQAPWGKLLQPACLLGHDRVELLVADDPRGETPGESLLARDLAPDHQSLCRPAP